MEFLLEWLFAFRDILADFNVTTATILLHQLRSDCRLFCLFTNAGKPKIHNIGATLVGVDKFGNKYYEKLGDTQYGVDILSDVLYYYTFDLNSFFL